MSCPRAFGNVAASARWAWRAVDLGGGVEQQVHQRRMNVVLREQVGRGGDDRDVARRQVVGDVDDAARHRQHGEMSIALRVRHRVHEAHLLQVAPAQERRRRSAPRSRRPGTRRRLRRHRARATAPRRRCGRNVVPRRVDAAFAAAAATRAIACRCPRRRSPSGFPRAPRACRPAAVRRPGISTSARSRARRAKRRAARRRRRAAARRCRPGRTRRRRGRRAAARSFRRRLASP